MSSDQVLYSIYDIDDNATDVSSAAMTFESGVLWTASWTPLQSNNYQIIYYNATQNVSHYEYVKVAGDVVGVAGGSGSGTSLTNLRSRFLRLVDNYNANDLTGTNSSGDIADLCINDALQLIYAQIKDSKWMKANPSTLASVADQAYIALSGISDLDEIISMQDTTNDLTLVEIPFWKLRFEVPDPANSTGTPARYARLFNRIYLDPRPTSVITYQVDYVKTYARLASDSDVALIPTKYDDWIYSEAKVLWYQMEDPSNTASIQIAIAERNDKRQIYINDVMSQFDLVSEGESHWATDEQDFPRFQSPAGQ